MAKYTSHGIYSVAIFKHRGRWYEVPSDMPVCVHGSASEHRCCHTLCACMAQLVWPADLLTGWHGTLWALWLAEHVLGPVVWIAPGFSHTFMVKCNYS